MVNEKRKIILLGSIAYDYLFSFPAKFIDVVSINYEKEEYQSTITADKKILHYGGIAGNIAYNLGLLNIGSATLFGAVGKDFENLGYKTHLSQFKNIEQKIDTHENDYTATCYIVNDIKANQMIIFHGGALDKCKDINLKAKIKDPENYFYAINSAQNVDAMMTFSNQLNDLKIPFIFDPGQVTSMFSKELLIKAVKSSKIIIGNKYEINQIHQKTGMLNQELIQYNKAIITTKGKEGSEIIFKNIEGEISQTNIPICKSEQILDTTGAGDAYRAGLLIGLFLNMTLLDSCRLGSVIASFTIETYGAQTQKYKISDVKKRFLTNYKNIPQELISINDAI